MTLSPAVLTVDERVKDCSLVLVNLNRIEMGQSEQQDSATQGTKVTESLFTTVEVSYTFVGCDRMVMVMVYLSEEVGSHFFGSDWVTTWAGSMGSMAAWAGSIALIDVFPSLYLIYI